MTKQRFDDRREAGRLLALQLQRYLDDPDAVVLALPRGGVPIGYEIAMALHLPLDICLVRKLGVPGQEELAMGAIAPNGVLVLNREVLRSLNLDQTVVDSIAAMEQQELERRQSVYRGEQQALSVQDRTVILVDDGIATGSTLRAAIAVLKQQSPQRMIVAVPVAPPSTKQFLETLVDEVVCLLIPEALNSIGQWYRDFSQTSDQEVCQLLEAATKQSL
jgi:putative phosphoribosyl transferase